MVVHESKCFYCHDKIFLQFVLKWLSFKRNYNGVLDTVGKHLIVLDRGAMYACKGSGTAKNLHIKLAF